jgi:hypothetical protein
MNRPGLKRLFLAALAVRVLAALAGGRLLGYSGDGLYDDGVFLQIAQSFVGRDPMIVATHPPLFSALLAPFMLVPGDAGYTLARAMMLVLGAAVAPLTVVLAESLGVAEQGAALAGVLAAASPLLVYFSTRFMSEIPFTILTILFFLVWLAAWRHGDDKRAALAGVIGGLASLTRTVFMPFGGALAVAAFVLGRSRPRWLRLIVVCGAAWAATIAPWTIRNWVRFQRFVPISVQGGWNFYEGLVVSEEDAARRPYEMTLEAQAHHVTGVFEANDYFAAKAKDEIARDPAGFSWLCVRKAFKFWRILPYYPRNLFARLLIGLFTLCVFALAAIGLFGLPAREAWGFVVAWAVFMTVMHALFASALRYRLPLEPFIFCAAGVGAAGLLGARSRSISTPQPRP